MLLQLLWPLVVIGFVACVFVLLVLFVGYAVRDHDAAASSAGEDMVPTPASAQPGTHAPA